MTTEPLWLAQARLDLGLRETPSKHTSHPRIDDMYRTVGHTWAAGDDSEVAWCAAATGTWLAEAGMPYIKGKGALGAVSYEKYGRRLNTMGAIPPGAICIFYRTAKRERDWRRHVAVAVKSNSTYVWCIGGNQSNEVNVRRFKRSDLSAVRWPVPSTVRDLKEAGSTEIKNADTIKKITVGTGIVTGAGSIITESTSPDEIAKTARDVGDHMDTLQAFLRSVGGLWETLSSNLWIIPAAIVLVLVYLAANRLQKRRLERHDAGDPISSQSDD